MGGRDDALAEGRALHAGDVLLAHALAGLARRLRLAGRCLLHRGDALRERSPRVTGDVLLALLTAKLAERLGVCLRVALRAVLAVVWVRCDRERGREAEGERRDRCTELKRDPHLASF